MNTATHGQAGEGANQAGAHGSQPGGVGPTGGLDDPDRQEASPPQGCTSEGRAASSALKLPGDAAASAAIAGQQPKSGRRWPSLIEATSSTMPRRRTNLPAMVWGESGEGFTALAVAQE